MADAEEHAGTTAVNDNCIISISCIDFYVKRYSMTLNYSVAPCMRMLEVFVPDHHHHANVLELRTVTVVWVVQSKFNLSHIYSHMIIVVNAHWHAGC
jgi:hypothetical protein